MIIDQNGQDLECCLSGHQMMMFLYILLIRVYHPLQVYHQKQLPHHAIFKSEIPNFEVIYQIIIGRLKLPLT